MKLLLLLLISLSSLCNAKPAPDIQLAKNFSEQPIIIEHYWVSENSMAFVVIGQATNY